MKETSVRKGAWSFGGGAICPRHDGAVLSPTTPAHTTIQQGSQENMEHGPTPQVLAKDGAAFMCLKGMRTWRTIMLAATRRAVTIAVKSALAMCVGQVTPRSLA